MRARCTSCSSPPPRSRSWPCCSQCYFRKCGCEAWLRRPRPPPTLGVGLPGSPDSTDQLENVVSHLLRKPGADAEVYALSGCPLDVATAWGLLQVFLHGPLVGRQTRQADIEAAVGLPAGVLATFFDGIVSAGLLQRHGDELGLTQTGQEQVRRITDAYVAWLLDQLRDWLPSDTGQRQRVADALTRVAVRMVRESWRSA